jgi:hypothetical protein
MMDDQMDDPVDFEGCTCTYHQSFKQPIWKVYSLVHDSDTFEALLDGLSAYQQAGDMVVVDVDFDDYRLDSYDDGNPLSMSMRDVMCIHLRLDVQFRDSHHVVTFEWWNEGRCHQIRFN